MSGRRPKPSRRAKPGSRPPAKAAAHKSHGAPSSRPRPPGKPSKPAQAARNTRVPRAKDAPPIAKAAFSWFPPHMHRTQQKLLEEARRADLIIEVRDARLPLGSGNPELEGVARSKPRLLLFNKASLADPGASRAWAAFFRAQGIRALFLDAETPSAAKTIQAIALELTQPLRDAFAKRGMVPPEPRVIVLGIPNVGKSTLINRLLQRKRLATGPQPGVTRQSTWAPLRGKLLLMDTPGVLLPRIATDEQAQRLGWIGALPQHLIGPERLARGLIAVLFRDSPGALARAYPSDTAEPASADDWLPGIARRRHFLTGHGEPDLLRAADQILRDFREGKLGPLTLEPAPTRSE